MNSSLEVAANSGSVDIYDAVAASEKHGKKKRKKQREIKPAGEATAEPEAEESRKDKGKQKQEIEASNDSRFVGGEGPAGAEDSRKDEKKKKKKREVKVSNDSESVIREGPAEREVKQSRKDKKKKRDIEVSNENESVSGGGPAGAEDSRKDEKKKKKREVKVSNDSESVIREGPAEPEVEQSRKDKKKKGDIEVSNENNSVSGGGLAKPAGEGSRKDGKKKRKRESSGEEDTKGKETAKEDKKSRKRKKRKKKDAAEGAEEDKVDEVGSSVGKDSEPKKRAVKPRPKESKKKVSFSGNVEVFPPKYDDSEGGTVEPLVQGKRYTPEEDKLIKEAVFKFIEVNQLGEEGLQMVLSSSKHPQLRNCWKEIGASLSWRPWESVYYRAHVLFERSEKRKWEPEEYEALRSFYNKHGADWKTLAKILGKHRIHVKDTWRRIGMPNKKKGNWSQEEYQGLFDLVNLDLKIKALEEKKTKHGMLRDNISWGAISEKLSTRFSAACCMKWYDQLASPLVKEGMWVDSDDYRLVDALQKLDACCVADVDWDNLLKHRSGEICRKRWDQMVRHIGGNLEKSFVEQVDVLSKRYRSEMMEYRKE